jgi:rubrerythrin
MGLNTASAVISFARKLEEDGIKLYEGLAQQYPQDRETWLALARENKRNIVQVERAYYGVITDALEGCFSFKMSPDEYAFERELKEDASYSEALNQALAMENRIIGFYYEAAKQSESLLADVPRAFTMVAKRRGDRCSKLRSLLAKGAVPNQASSMD